MKINELIKSKEVGNTINHIITNLRKSQKEDFLNELQLCSDSKDDINKTIDFLVLHDETFCYIHYEKILFESINKILPLEYNHELSLLKNYLLLARKYLHTDNIQVMNDIIETLLDVDHLLIQIGVLRYFSVYKNELSNWKTLLEKTSKSNFLKPNELYGLYRGI